MTTEPTKIDLDDIERRATGKAPAVTLPATVSLSAAADLCTIGATPAETRALVAIARKALALVNEQGTRTVLGDRFADGTEHLLADAGDFAGKGFGALVAELERHGL